MTDVGEKQGGSLVDECIVATMDAEINSLKKEVTTLKDDMFALKHRIAMQDFEIKWLSSRLISSCRHIWSSYLADPYTKGSLLLVEQVLNERNESLKDEWWQ